MVSDIDKDESSMKRDSDGVWGEARTVPIKLLWVGARHFLIIRNKKSE